MSNPRRSEAAPIPRPRRPPFPPPSPLPEAKIDPLLAAGFALSRNDRKIILYGQLLTTLAAAPDAGSFAPIVDAEPAAEECRPAAASNRPAQQILFERV